VYGLIKTDSSFLTPFLIRKSLTFDHISTLSASKVKLLISIFEGKKKLFFFSKKEDVKGEKQLIAFKIWMYNNLQSLEV
jgi:hypothetical protein